VKSLAQYFLLRAFVSGTKTAGEVGHRSSVEMMIRVILYSRAVAKTKISLEFLAIEVEPVSIVADPE
jgi:hypothetical protein